MQQFCYGHSLWLLKRTLQHNAIHLRTSCPPQQQQQLPHVRGLVKQEWHCLRCVLRIVLDGWASFPAEVRADSTPQKVAKASSFSEVRAVYLLFRQRGRCQSACSMNSCSRNLPFYQARQVGLQNLVRLRARFCGEEAQTTLVTSLCFRTLCFPCLGHVVLGPAQRLIFSSSCFARALRYQTAATHRFAETI